MLHYYAVSYLDKNGFPVSYGYANDTEKHDPGTILTSWSGQKIRIDFECSEKPCF